MSDCTKKRLKERGHGWARRVSAHDAVKSVCVKKLTEVPHEAKVYHHRDRSDILHDCAIELGISVVCLGSGSIDHATYRVLDRNPRMLAGCWCSLDV